MGTDVVLVHSTTSTNQSVELETMSVIQRGTTAEHLYVRDRHDIKVPYRVTRPMNFLGLFNFLGS